MEEPLSIGAAFENFLREYLGENGGGFPLAFVCLMEYVDGDGNTIPAIAEMPNQTTIRSMGFATYLDAWYKDDARVAWQEQIWQAGDDE